MARSRTTWTREHAQALARANHAKATAASVLAAKARAERRRALDLAPALIAAAQTIAPGNDFASATLGRVRAQVLALLDLLQAESAKRRPDGQRLNWLAAALERLAELERRLAGRPMPGTVKPQARPSRPAPPTLARPTIAESPEPEPQAGGLTERPEW